LSDLHQSKTLFPPHHHLLNLQRSQENLLKSNSTSHRKTKGRLHNLRDLSNLLLRHLHQAKLVPHQMKQFSKSKSNLPSNKTLANQQDSKIDSKICLHRHHHHRHTQEDNQSTVRLHHQKNRRLLTKFHLLLGSFPKRPDNLHLVKGQSKGMSIIGQSRIKSTKGRSRSRNSKGKSRNKTIQDLIVSKIIKDQSRNRKTLGQIRNKTTIDLNRGKIHQDKSRNRISTDLSKGRIYQDLNKNRITSDRSRSRTITDLNKDKITSDQNRNQINSNVMTLHLTINHRGKRIHLFQNKIKSPHLSWKKTLDLFNPNLT